MKVCAAINLGPWNRMSLMFDTIGDAVGYFRSEIAGVDFGTGTDDQVMDLYPACTGGVGDLHCTDNETYHDYPLTRFVVGPRGGVARVNV